MAKAGKAWGVSDERGGGDKEVSGRTLRKDVNRARRRETHSRGYRGARAVVSTRARAFLKGLSEGEAAPKRTSAPPPPRRRKNGRKPGKARREALQPGKPRCRNALRDPDTPAAPAAPRKSPSQAEAGGGFQPLQVDKKGSEGCADNLPPNPHS